ncbi:MAG: hypothetical protein HYT37_04245 [Candidatus Sungbacteria bacterium]|nr:hypothetical protein [Candidatus Sungbacteria bacterium]
MSYAEKFRLSRYTLVFVAALMMGAVLGFGASVWATSLGTDLTVSGTATVTGNTTLSGTATIAGGLTVSTTGTVSTFSTGGLNVGSGQFVIVQTTGLVGVGTSTPAQLLSVGGSLFVGASASGGTSGGLGVGQATTTAGVIQTASTTNVTLFQSDVSITSAGTSTLRIAPSGKNRRGCIELTGEDGTFALYATTTGPAILNSGVCE